MKKILALLLAASMLFSLTACHGQRGLNAFEMPEEFDESKEYNITFWSKNDTNKTQVEIYNKAISDFEKLYPNIHVNMRIYTDYTLIYNDVITNISTNTTPNVCISYPDHIATYLTGVNIVAPLEELMDNADYGLGGNKVKFDSPAKSQMILKFLEEGEINGSYYALPFMRSTEALYINKTYVERLGYSVPDKVTWDWIWEVADAAMAKNEDGTFKLNGKNVMIPFIYKSTDNMMIQMLKQKGADYSTPEGEIKIFNDDTKDILYTVRDHAEKESFSTFKISSYPANFLNAGECIFAIDSTAGSTWMGTEAPLSDICSDDIADPFETVVRVIPQFDVENPAMISQGPSICIFNKNDSGEVLASWLFAQFLLTNDVQIAYAKTEGYVPVTSKAQETEAYLQYLADSGIDNNEHYSIKIDATKLLLENTDNTFVTPVFNGSASLRNAAGQMIENVTKSVRRKQTVDEAYMDKLYSDINSLYRLDQADTSNTDKDSLGPLPAESKALLTGLIVVWIFIILYFCVKNRKK
ncbi:MAG: extracellular solute-binding protein [Bacillota bacterium]|nr:extracellular solute-binding protein [Bacillota bacterium]